MRQRQVVPHLKDEEPGAQKNENTCPKPHS